MKHSLRVLKSRLNIKLGGSNIGTNGWMPVDPTGHTGLASKGWGNRVGPQPVKCGQCPCAQNIVDCIRMLTVGETLKQWEIIREKVGPKGGSVDGWMDPTFGAVVVGGQVTLASGST